MVRARWVTMRSEVYPRFETQLILSFKHILYTTTNTLAIVACAVTSSSSVNHDRL